MSGFNAPARGGNRTKNPNVELLKPDFHLCRLYGIVDMGTHLNEKFGTKRHKVRLLFEFPYLVQFYYEEDTEPKPAMVSVECTLSMNEKAILRKFVESMLGKRFNTDQEAEQFDLFSLADKYYVANITHQASKKDPSKVYENISSLSPYSDKFLEKDKELHTYNDLMLYSISEHKFSGENWLKLYRWMRNTIKDSDEGVQHSAKGGTFEEPKQDNQEPGANGGGVNSAVTQATPPAPKPQAPAGHPIEMLVEPKDVQIWLDKGWTYDLLVQHGHAKKIEVTSPASAGPPQPPSSPSGQPSVAPQPKSDAPEPIGKEDDDLPF